MVSRRMERRAIGCRRPFQTFFISRTGWDSNPRYAFTHTSFPGLRLKPLGHPSLHLRSFVHQKQTTGVAGSSRAATPVAVMHSRSGQGEIRTLDTGFTGMPVFETGAFSHSATCPTYLFYKHLQHPTRPASIAAARASARLARLHRKWAGISNQPHATSRPTASFDRRSRSRRPKQTTKAGR